MIDLFRSIILIIGFLAVSFLALSYRENQKDTVTLFTRRIANFFAVFSIIAILLPLKSANIPQWVAILCLLITISTVLLSIGTTWFASGRTEEDAAAKLVMVHFINIAILVFVLVISVADEGRELLREWLPWSDQHWASKSTWSNWQSVIQLVIAIGATAGAFVGVRTRTIDQEEALINEVQSTMHMIENSYHEKIKAVGDLEEEYDRMKREFTKISESFCIYKNSEIDIMLTYVITAMICIAEFCALVYSSIYHNDPITIWSSAAILMGGIPTIAILLASMASWMRRLGHLKEVRHVSSSFTDFERRLRQAH